MAMSKQEQEIVKQALSFLMGSAMSGKGGNAMQSLIGAVGGRSSNGAKRGVGGSADIADVAQGLGNVLGGAANVSNTSNVANGGNGSVGGNRMDYGVIFVPGDAQLNRKLVRTPENIAATNLQTDSMHQALLNKFASDPEIPPEQARRLGEREEQNAPEFWYDDQYPRRPITPSSSAVSSVVVDGNVIKVKFGTSPKEYTYRGGADYREATEEAAKLITSGSLGKAINRYHGWWGTTHHI